MADAADLKSEAYGRVGSNPTGGTIREKYSFYSEPKGGYMVFEHVDGVFTNYWGVEEAYTRKSITSYMSGHSNRGSAFYSDHECGNCDGGRCDSCEEIYVVISYGPPKYNGMYEETTLLFWKRFVDINEAFEFYNSL